MMKRIVAKGLALFLVAVMLLPLVSLNVSVQQSDMSYFGSAQLGDYEMPLAKITNKMRLEQIEKDNAYVKKYVKGQMTKKDLQDVQETFDTIRKGIPVLVSFAKDLADQGDFDTAKCVEDFVSLASDIANLCGPYGMLVGAGINLIHSLVKVALGGEAERSEIAELEDRLNQKFNEIQEQLVGIEESIGGLSDEINAQTQEILDGVTTIIDNAFARQELRDFKISKGESDFGYDEYRNYLFGSLSDNGRASTAYYAKIKDAQARGAEDEVKYYYDQFYSAWMQNKVAYYDYLCGTEESSSIVQYYYEIVSADPKADTLNGLTPGAAALLFAHDLYQTELRMNVFVSACNEFQRDYMEKTGATWYQYGDETERIYLSEIIDENNIDAQNLARVEDIETQLAEDIIYILGLDGFYSVVGSNGDIYEVTDADPDTFGFVKEGQTILLHQVPNDICAVFGFDKKNFTFSYAEDGSDMFTVFDGVLTVGNVQTVTIAFNYCGVPVETLQLTVGDNEGFNGGSGTKDDPYLIATPDQFLAIGEGLDLYYRLVDNIDFSEIESIAPIGQKTIKNTIVEHEFSGSLDGNGYMVKNLTVESRGEFSGLFAKIGESGTVTDLSFYNVKVDVSIGNVEKASNQIFAGIVAGVNSGTIENCDVSSDGTLEKEARQYLLSKNGKEYESTVCLQKHGVFVEVNNSNLDRNIFVYVGGIAGRNMNCVRSCLVDNISLFGFSTHSFAGERDTDHNQNCVYVGGVCAENYSTVETVFVGSKTKLIARARSIHNPNTTINPYVYAYAGGIAAYTRVADQIKNVQSEAQILECAYGLRCESGYGPKYRNCKAPHDPYVPESSKEDIENMKAKGDLKTELSQKNYTYAVTYAYGKKNAEGEYLNSIYEAGSEAFVTKDLELFVNGQKKEYTIVALYGFNTKNITDKDILRKVTVLFSIEDGDETVYLTQTIPIRVKVNGIVRSEIILPQDSYLEGEFTPNGLTVKHYYAAGEVVEVPVLNVKDTDWSGDINKLGKQPITLTYGGKTYSFDIFVACAHEGFFWEEYELVKTEAATCTKSGTEYYRCNDCGDEREKYILSKGHTEALVGVKASSCTEKGYTGDLCCKYCDVVFEKGRELPLLAHNYKHTDDTIHTCDVCGATENHHYSVTERLKTVEENGVARTYIAYEGICTCTYDEGGCTYTHKKDLTDENAITDVEKALPIVVVSNGHALYNKDGEVVIYVQLMNNPGVSAASFGVRYDQGLELVRHEYGDIFANGAVKVEESVAGGYNFVMADAAIFADSGNLLKLVFRVTDEKTLGKEYGISVVYAFGEVMYEEKNYQVRGGFTTNDDGLCQFVTRAGTIKIVERLPGDVNGDGVVDLEDAIEIARFIAGNENSAVLDEGAMKYANVNLALPKPGDAPVNNADLVAILRHLVGGYGDGSNLMTSDVKLLLNANLFGDDQLPQTELDVAIGESTYSSVGIENLSRPGYKFLGWSYKVYAPNDLVDLGAVISYNSDQRKQTLYAQWEMNSFSFNGNGNTNTDFVMAPLFYSEKEITAPQSEFEKVYNVSFKELAQNGTLSASQTLSYRCVGFYFMDGNKEILYKTMEDVVNALKDQNYGNIELYVKWELEAFDLPVWTKAGYRQDITWYADDKETVVADLASNPEKILNTVQPNRYGEYPLYAEFSPITYFLTVDLTGFTGSGIGVFGIDDKGYSVEKTFEFPAVHGLKKTGHTVNDDYSLWKIKGTDQTVVLNGNTLNYVPTPEMDGKTVVLVPTATPNEYTLKFDVNDGKDGYVFYTINGNDTHIDASNVAGNREKIPTSKPYLYGNEVKLPMLDYEIKGWTFVGWSLTPNGDIIENHTIAHLNREGTTVYAVWEVNPHKVGQVVANGAVVSGTNSSSKQYIVYNDITKTADVDVGEGLGAIIDWSSATGGQYASMIENTAYQGNNTHFDIFCNWLEKPEDVYFVGNPATTYEELFIFVVENAANTTLNIHLVDFKFKGFIRAWNADHDGLTVELICKGNNAITSTDADAAIGSTLDALWDFNSLVITGSGTLTVNGAAGTSGTNGSSYSSNGADANAGKAGTNAVSNGGNGTIGIAVDSLTVDMTGTLVVRGGDGGKGGDGGSGAHGANGTTDGGSGSTGGAGGHGANGGNGAVAVSNNTKIVVRSGNAFLLNGSGGNGGDGGDGGRGGAGNRGSNAYQGHWVLFVPGVDHHYGVAGGNGGNGGVGGNGGNGGLGAVSAFTNKASVAANANLYIFAGNRGNGGNGGAGGYGNQGGLGGSCDGVNSGKGCGNHCTCGGKGGDGGFGGLGGKAGSGATAGTPGAGGFGGLAGGRSHELKECYCQAWGADRSSIQAGHNGEGTSYGSNTSQYNGGIVTSTDLFASGVLDGSGFRRYDNEGKGVTLKTLSSSSGNPTGLNHVLEVNGKKDACNGQSGGYITEIPSSPDTTYYYVICAKLENGVAIEMAHNKMGAADWSAKESEWLTSNKGTGEWQWYVGKLVSYPDGISGGIYSSLGHVFAKINKDITWSVAYHAIVECPN